MSYFDYVLGLWPWMVPFLILVGFLVIAEIKDRRDYREYLKRRRGIYEEKWAARHQREYERKTRRPPHQ